VGIESGGWGFDGNDGDDGAVGDFVEHAAATARAAASKMRRRFRERFIARLPDRLKA
jgi:hypothetical protein